MLLNYKLVFTGFQRNVFNCERVFIVNNLAKIKQQESGFYRVVVCLETSKTNQNP